MESSAMKVVKGGNNTVCDAYSTIHTPFVFIRLGCYEGLLRLTVSEALKFGTSTSAPFRGCPHLAPRQAAL
jgi:hypothetical protein